LKGGGERGTGIPEVPKPGILKAIDRWHKTEGCVTLQTRGKGGKSASKCAYVTG